MAKDRHRRGWRSDKLHGRDPGPGFGGTMRASQAVSTYGAGALMDLINEAVLIAGLDYWHYENQDGFIVEPRLRDVVANLLRKHNHPVSLSRDRAFRLAPTSEEKQPSRASGIRVLQFPTWFVCQGCRSLVHTSVLLDQRQGPYEHDCDVRRQRKPRCVPVRFVLTCRRGHLEDFRWIDFVHELQDIPRCAGPSIKLDEGGTGDVSDIVVRCASCDAPPRPIVAAYANGACGKCDGRRPWLGPDAHEDCGEPLHLLIRSASNSYFPQIISALSIPDPSRKLDDAVSSKWTYLSIVESEEELKVIRKQTGNALKDFSNDQLLEAIERIKKDEVPERQPVRTAEFKQLVQAAPERTGDLPAPRQDFFARSWPVPPSLKPWVSKVVLVHQLREVSAQVGFTRLEAPTPDLQGEFDLGVTSAALGLTTDWVPATEVRGEGIFIQFSEAAVASWEKRTAVVHREQALKRGFEAWRRQRAAIQGISLEKLVTIPFPRARFYMLHSLSHLLMNALSLECGYSASALSERVYCASPEDSSDFAMAGILISTGTSGAEGTLGGLVEQGRELERHLKRAVELGQLCSHDPVCASHSPSDDKAERHLEGAACHGCLFIAECSCERFNQYLDRALVVPTIGHENMAFLPANF